MSNQSQDARRHEGNQQHRTHTAPRNVEKHIDRQHVNNVPADSVTAEQLKQVDQETNEQLSDTTFRERNWIMSNEHHKSDRRPNKAELECVPVSLRSFQAAPACGVTRTHHGAPVGLTWPSQG